MAITTCLSTVILSVNGLNDAIQRHRVAEWIRKQDPYIGFLQETHFRLKDILRLKVKGWKKIFYENIKRKKCWDGNT